MRILVLQLARFGDIYQSWPALNALKRAYPEGELHVLVRESFKAALSGFGGIHIHSLSIQNILDPIINSSDEKTSTTLLNQFIEPLINLKFDKIINLSFSPASSYLTDILASDKCEVRGYSRFSDGYLNITDDSSAYFYAQGEIGKHNRFHITQLFASVAGVDLEDQDFQFRAKRAPIKDQVIVHLGASQADRVYPAELWVEALTELAKHRKEQFLLIGGPSEAPLAKVIVQRINQPNVKSVVGQTSFAELMNIIAEAKLFIGCDSGPSQIASLTQTPVLQLTSDASNFWTTGPTSAGSRLLYEAELNEITVARIVEEGEAMLGGRKPLGPCILRTSQLGEYVPFEMSFDNFSWNLIQALYTNGSYPDTDSEVHLLAFQRIFELSELALQQLSRWQESKYQKTAALILQNVDEMLAEVAKLNPKVAPLIHWFETEKLRLPPDKPELTLEKTAKLFSDLHLITSIYRRYSDAKTESQKAAELCGKISPHFREYRLNIVQEDFQHLISTLQELSRHSTKVGESEWYSLLSGLNEALDRRDLIEVADQLEYVIKPALS